MKRPSPSFVVQHKRRSRLGKDEPASIWSDDVGRELRGLLRDASEPPADDRRDASVGPAAALGETGASAAPKRILEARAEPRAPGEPVTGVEPARRGRPRKRRDPVDPPVPDPTTHVAEGAVEVHEEAAPVLAVAEDPIPAPLPSVRGERPSFRERRRAARQALPLADRWRWNLRY